MKSRCNKLQSRREFAHLMSFAQLQERTCCSKALEQTHSKTLLFPYAESMTYLSHGLNNQNHYLPG